MGKFIDLTGYKQPNGRLTVIERAPNRGEKVYWKCQCDCGNEIEVQACHLKSEKITNCGCQINRRTNYKDLTNKTFGKLHVDGPAKSRNHRAFWKCTCECGNTIEVSSEHLVRHQVISCGCEHKKLIQHDLKDMVFGELKVIEKTDKRDGTNIIWKCRCSCGTICEKPGSPLVKGAVKSCGCLISCGEKKISNLLSDNNIDFRHQKTYERCKYPSSDHRARFDFFIDNRYLLEYDGKQHYESVDYFGGEEKFKEQKERDAYKNQWCKENNIPLIRIPYWHLDDLCIDDLRLETTKFRVV